MDPFAKVPGFKIDKKIGEGATASVYLCIHEKLGCKRAVKVLNPALLNKQVYVRRLLKEARIASKLTHPGIVQIYDVKQTSSLSYIVMEYLGKSLKDKLGAGNHLPDTEICRIIKQVAGALDYAHSQGVAHRDIKPANILFKEDGTPVLVDFGLALDNDPNETRTMSNNPEGTGNYMSPEQCRGEKGDYASDFYSLGVVLFEMLQGEVPYKSDNFLAVIDMHKSSPIPRLPARVSRYQPLIDRLMAKDRKERLKDGRQIICMIDDLMVCENKENTHKERLKTPVLETQKIPSPLPPNNRKLLYKNPGKKKKRIDILKSMLLISIGLFAIVVALLVYYYWNTHREKAVDGVIESKLNLSARGLNAWVIKSMGIEKKAQGGGVIKFEPDGGKFRDKDNVIVRLSIVNPLKISQGDVIDADIYYTLDGTDPTKERGVKYKEGTVVALQKEGTYTLKAQLISKVGQYAGPLCSKTYTIETNPIQIIGGSVRFDKSGGEYKGPLQIQLSFEPLRFSDGKVVESDLYYTIGPDESGKIDGKRYSSVKLDLTKGGTYPVKAWVSSRDGKHKGLLYSQTYNIRPVKPPVTEKIKTVESYNDLDPGALNDILERTQRIEISGEGVRSISMKRNTSIAYIDLFFSSSGKVQGNAISGIEVEPPGMIGEIKSRLAQEIEGIKLLKPTCKGKPVNFKKWIAFYSIALFEGKIVFNRRY